MHIVHCCAGSEWLSECLSTCLVRVQPISWWTFVSPYPPMAMRKKSAKLPKWYGKTVLKIVLRRGCTHSNLARHDRRRPGIDLRGLRISCVYTWIFKKFTEYLMKFKFSKTYAVPEYFFVVLYARSASLCTPSMILWMLEYLPSAGSGNHLAFFKKKIF